MFKIFQPYNLIREAIIKFLKPLVTVVLISFFYKQIVLLYLIIHFSIIISVATISSNPQFVNYVWTRPSACENSNDIFLYIINSILVYRWCFFYNFIIKKDKKINFKYIISSVLLDPKFYILLILNIPIRLTKIILLYFQNFITNKPNLLHFNVLIVDIFFPKHSLDGLVIFYNGSGWEAHSIWTKNN